MVAREILVLDAGSSSMRKLATRMNRLGYSVVPAKTPDQADRLIQTRAGAVPAAVIPVDLPAFDLRAALRFMRKLAATSELTYVVAGARPEPAERQLLREAGVELALWEPVGDHSLRFQVNRALAGSEIVRGSRSSLRAPADWPVAVHVGDRRKAARVYTISMGGAYLSTWRPSLPGTRVEFDLPLRSGPLRIPAEVVMTNVPGHFLRQNLPVGMGLRFEDPDPRIEMAIARYADRKLTQLGF